MAKNQPTVVNFASVRKFDYPDFLDIQLKSFKEFFQLETNPDDREHEGLYKVFAQNFPVKDQEQHPNYTLDFLDYFIDPPHYTINECIDRGLTYSVPIRAKFRLTNHSSDVVDEDKKIVVEDVYLGLIPYMTPKGTFVINGAERVVVSQLHRSPGVFFNINYHINGTKLYEAKIIPMRGTWVTFATDMNEVLYALIDQKKKVPVTTLLRALSSESLSCETDQDILKLFFLNNTVDLVKENRDFLVDKTLGAAVIREEVDAYMPEDMTGDEVVIKRNIILYDVDQKLTADMIDDLIEQAEAGQINKSIIIKETEMPPYSENRKSLSKEEKEKKKELEGLNCDVIYNTLRKDTSHDAKEAASVIYRIIRNAEPTDETTAINTINGLFNNSSRYDLGVVGRHRLNTKLNLTDKKNETNRTLTLDDIRSIIIYIIKLINQKAELDDIDHLSNRRVRTVGEQLANQFNIGLARMSRTIKERMNVRDSESLAPMALINSKSLSSVINQFFCTNQLSQFMDQTNPLAEVTHKRRISALGPGGLTRERAGFDVRDVHYTHYGRLCTIETPEGPNIGLISSLCVYAQINELGFIETPYKRVVNGRVMIEEEPVYYTAEDEEHNVVAQATTKQDENGNILEEMVKVRQQADFPLKHPSEVDLIDVASNQIASIAASLIPFLEHDDANRALMGSNMMRQAVPLLNPEIPIVGTGIEEAVAKDSRILLNAEADGTVTYVDSTRIVVKEVRSERDRIVSFDSEEKEYPLTKYQRTNHSTAINLRPIVKKGDRVKKGQVLCEGFATQNGELALGRNLKVAFMPWKGYNYEDAVVISERVVREDIFTSVHIEEFSLDVRETKRGQEELTPDIPNVGSEATKDLDKDGLIRIGAEVKAGDILIGKITPKGETDPTPEEKLLRAIFGDKAGDVKDASLKVPPSVRGVVIDRKLYKKIPNTEQLTKKEKEKILEEPRNIKAHDEKELKDKLIDKLFEILNGKVSTGVQNINKESVDELKKGVKFTRARLDKVENYTVLNSSNWTGDAETDDMVKDLLNNYSIKQRELEGRYKREEYARTVGDDLSLGVMQMAKVLVASKRKLRVGDKMAGRHGNKGIVSKIVRAEDMPFLADGTPVDIVLNPLGVPSRMNLGQIYETVLGWAGKVLDKRFKTPIFDGATLDQINALMREAGLPENGRTYLYDGETGDRFDQPATVGYIYMLKLHHLVDDKMHARSIGPYALITQQPLGGKANFGGQRFGEMEVWALEAFGASHVLQEVLTIKSDDQVGRAKAYEAITKGERMPTPGLPESFNVIVHELRGLGLEITFD